MSHLFHRFHWMFVPAFDAARGEAIPGGATIPARLAALEVYRREGRADDVILCTADEFRAGDRAHLRELEPAVSDIDWAGFDEALTELGELARMAPRRARISVTDARR